MLSSLQVSKLKLKEYPWDSSNIFICRFLFTQDKNVSRLLNTEVITNQSSKIFLFENYKQKILVLPALPNLPPTYRQRESNFPNLEALIFTKNVTPYPKKAPCRYLRLNQLTLGVCSSCKY